MKAQLKNLADQTIVITGASSGIGLKTARMAAQRGARLVLAARREDALRRLTEEINKADAKNLQAVYTVADVSRQADVQRIADAAFEHFGGFDTWINNAGVSVFGKLLDV